MIDRDPQCAANGDRAVLNCRGARAEGAGREVESAGDEGRAWRGFDSAVDRAVEDQATLVDAKSLLHELADVETAAEGDARVWGRHNVDGQRQPLVVVAGDQDPDIVGDRVRAANLGRAEVCNVE